MYLGGSCYTGIYDYIKDLEIAVIAMDSFRRMTHGTPWPKQHVLAKKKSEFEAAVPRTITGPLLVDDVTWSLTAQVLAASSHNICTNYSEDSRGNEAGCRN